MNKRPLILNTKKATWVFLELENTNCNEKFIIFFLEYRIVSSPDGFFCFLPDKDPQVAYLPTH